MGRVSGSPACQTRQIPARHRGFPESAASAGAADRGQRPASSAGPAMYEQSRLHSEVDCTTTRPMGPNRLIDVGRGNAEPPPSFTATTFGRCPRCGGYCPTCCRSCRCAFATVAEFLALAVLPLALGNKLTFDLRILKQAAPVGVPHRFDPGFDALWPGSGSVQERQPRGLRSRHLFADTAGWLTSSKDHRLASPALCSPRRLDGVRATGPARASRAAAGARSARMRKLRLLICYLDVAASHRVPPPRMGTSPV